MGYNAQSHIPFRLQEQAIYIYQDWLCGMNMHYILPIAEGFQGGSVLRAPPQYLEPVQYTMKVFLILFIKQSLPLFAKNRLPQ